MSTEMETKDKAIITAGIGGAAAAGAAIGSIVPGAGTLVGAGIGAIVGGIGTIVAVVVKNNK
ncbi:MAG: hypothetical protein FWG77_03920 [Treponema sp.]|nr:hypothetical protein [Treponema sp.]